MQDDCPYRARTWDLVDGQLAVPETDGRVVVLMPLTSTVTPGRHPGVCLVTSATQQVIVHRPAGYVTRLFIAARGARAAHPRED